MIERSLAHPGHQTTPGSTRHHHCDYEFLGLLEEDFGLDLFSLNRAWLWRYALRDSSLVEANLDPRLVRQSIFRTLIVQSVFLLSIGIPFISVDVARLSWLLYGH